MGLFCKNKDITVKSPVSGKTIPLSKVKDEVFSKKIMGDGLAIIPSDGNIYAPIDGRLSVVFETGHAYGIENKKGLSILIHIGVDTVNLKGKGFTPKVSQGQKVKSGDLLCVVDLPYLKKNAKSEQVIVLVTPESKLQIVTKKENSLINPTDTIITFKK